MNFLVAASIFGVLAFQLYFLRTYRGLLERDRCSAELSSVANTDTGVQYASEASAKDAVLDLCLGSSVTCHGDYKRDRQCKFTNLCFSHVHQDFVFFHGRKSRQFGIPENRFDPALLDFSSVDDHNGQYFNYVDVPVSTICQEGRFKDSVTYRDGNHLIMKRFKPDNLMHLFHDDLLPVFQTVGALESLGTSNISLVFADTYGEVRFDYIFDALNVREVMHLKGTTKNWTCFQNSYVGLRKETTWYQYGFNKTQGPIAHHYVQRKYLETFQEHLHWKLCKSSCPMKTELQNNPQGCDKDFVSPGKIILVSRMHTRLIVNEVELSLFLVKYFNLPVKIVRLEENTVEDLFCLMSHATVLVGMHGSLLILSLFLKTGSTIIELFPYAINPTDYTPYKTLAKILELHYVAWVNPFKEKSIPHPDWSEAFGGIRHLDEEEQDRITSTRIVPEHFCCSDPNWLYHIYQDTNVDTKSFENTLTAHLPSKHMKKHLGYNLYPSTVTNASCTLTKDTNLNVIFKIHWLEPWNIQYVHNANILYHVWVQLKEDNIHAYETNSTSLILSGLTNTDLPTVWIKCVHHGLEGPISATINCQS